MLWIWINAQRHVPSQHGTQISPTTLEILLPYLFIPPSPPNSDQPLYLFTIAIVLPLSERNVF